MRTILMVLVVGLVISQRGAGQAGADRAATGPVTVVTREGRSFSGRAHVPADGALALAVSDPASGGEIVYRFPFARIGHLKFTGAEAEQEAQERASAGDYREVVPILEPVAAQRLPFLALLSANQVAPLILLAEAYLHGGAPLRAVSLGRRLAAHLAPASPELSRLEETIMQAYWRLDLVEEARDLAQAWCRGRRPDGLSVAGWRVLAEIALADEDPGEALWLSLHPVAFASALAPARHLEFCYALAAVAHGRSGDLEAGASLLAEMEQLGLVWPSGALFDELLPRLREILSQAAAVENGPAGTQADPSLQAPPAPDLNLPLNAVRKLLASPPGASSL